MINTERKNRRTERQQSDEVEKRERERCTLALPCSRINKASHGKLSEAGYEREGGGEEEPLKAAWRNGVHPISLKQVLSATEARARLQAKKRAEFYSHN